jgi:hypothetical protein
MNEVIRFTQASRKHRLGRARIRYVMGTAQPQRARAVRGREGLL